MWGRNEREKTKHCYRVFCSSVVAFIWCVFKLLFFEEKKIKVLFGLTFLALRVILKLKVKIRVFRRNDIIVW
jgi:hypothetical protein